MNSDLAFIISLSFQVYSPFPGSPFSNLRFQLSPVGSSQFLWQTCTHHLGQVWTRESSWPGDQAGVVARALPVPQSTLVSLGPCHPSVDSHQVKCSRTLEKARGLPGAFSADSSLLAQAWIGGLCSPCHHSLCQSRNQHHFYVFLLRRLTGFPLCPINQTGLEYVK